MPLTAVDFDPFADEAPAGLTPVDYDPFEGDPELTPGASSEITWGDVGRGAIETFPEAAKQYGQDIWTAVSSPIDTAMAVGRVAIGAVQKLIPGEQDYEADADAVGRFFADRYGGMENIKRTIATDLPGFMADASTVLTAGAGAAARVPSLAGQVAKAAGTAGAMMEPVSLVAKAAKVAGKSLGKPFAHALGWSTGAKGEAVMTAARTGYQGGNMAELFRGAMRGTVPLEDVVTQARGAIANMYQRRSQAYQANMGSVRADAAVLDFKGIDDALAKAENVKTFKGRDLSPKTQGIRNEMREAIQSWRALDPVEYHTPAGFDALKQTIGDIQQSVKYGTPERKIADQVYNAIKGEITKQAPEYAKAMKEYAEATEHLREIEGALSLGKKARTETALRKLQAIIRNDVSSAYGHRGNLANTLEEAGAAGLREQLSGHALSSPVPRGMATVTTPLAIAGSSVMSPGALAAVPLASPRIVGEVVHAGGRAARTVADAVAGAPINPGATAAGAFQAGRTERVDDIRIDPATGARYLLDPATGEGVLIQ